jgi:hypothetical protein
MGNLIDDPAKHSFHDTDLSPKVAHARHALAIDETRQSFMPTLWTNIDDRPTVKQVWFPGVHSDVGGGYAHCGLSDGALKWMIEEAQDLGLVFRDRVIEQVRPDARGLLHDSCIGLFARLKTRPREIPRIAQEALAKGRLHSSARGGKSGFRGSRWSARWPMAGVPTTTGTPCHTRPS